MSPFLRRSFLPCSIVESQSEYLASGRLQIALEFSQDLFRRIHGTDDCYNIHFHYIRASQSYALRVLIYRESSFKMLLQRAQLGN